MNKNYWVIRMGEANKYADFAYQKNVVAIGWNEIGKDLSPYQHFDKKAYFEALTPILETAYPDHNKAGRSMIAGQLFRFCSLMQVGDLVLVPKTKEGKMYLGTIESDYFYQTEVSNECLYHHYRTVKWVSVLNLKDISQELRSSIGALMTVFSVNKYADEIESLVVGKESTENLENFGLESQLEDFIVENWEKLELNSQYKILSEDGVVTGQQYVTPVGRIDILARSKDKKEWLVIELKKDLSSDKVVGQTLRYIAWIQENEAGVNETVRGLIITKDQDEKLKYALKATSNIDSMTYSVSFRLSKAE